MKTKRPLLVLVVGFLLGVYSSFFVEYYNIRVMPIICIVGIISGMIFIVFDKKRTKKVEVFILASIFYLFGILFFIYFQENIYSAAVNLSGTTKNVLIEIEGVNKPTNYGFSYFGKIIGYEKGSAGRVVKLKLYCSKELVVGDVINSNVKFILPQNHSNFDYRNYLASKGCFLQGSISKKEVIYNIEELKNNSWILSFRQYVKEVFLKYLNEENAGLALAMTIGDRDFLPEANYKSYSASGLIHIISISGSHFSILTSFLASFLQKINVKRKLTAILSIIFIMVYYVIAGDDPAVFRSAIMSLIYFLAVIFSREYDMLSALAFAALLSCIINPYSLIGLSFVLSYASIIAIIYIVPKLRERLISVLENIKGKNFSEFGKFYRIIIEGLSLSLGVNLALLPFSIYYFRRISLVAPITNIIAEPIVNIILFLSILLPAVNVFKIEYLSKFISAILDLFINIFNAISNVFSNLPLSSVYIWGKYLGVWIICIVVFILIYKNNKKKMARAVAFPLIFLMIFSYMTEKYNISKNTYFYSVNLYDSNSFLLYNDKEVIVHLGKATIYDGKNIDSILEKNNKDIISVLIISDDYEGSIESTVELIKKYEVKNILAKSGVVKTDDNSNMLLLKENAYSIYNTIDIVVKGESMRICLEDFSVSIINDEIFSDYTNILYVESKLEKQKFKKINGDFLIRKAEYKTNIYQALPNKFGEINLIYKEGEYVIN